MMLLVFAVSCGNHQTVTSQKDFNIILITIDTLRADSLSCYGNDRNTSPTIDRIAKQGIIFKHVVAPSSWTVPSMVSLFTSVYPINHGSVQGAKKGDEVYKQEVFSGDLSTLAEILKEDGYTTFGVASNHHLQGKFGFARGFDYFRHLLSLSAPRVNEVIYSWKNDITTSDKFFLWVHYFDPHWPYTPREPWADRNIPDDQRFIIDLLNKIPNDWRDGVSYLNNLIEKYPATLSILKTFYESEINYVDKYIGAFLKKFEPHEDTVIIITSDHGEAFWEHALLGHGGTLYQEVIQVPLIVKLPPSLQLKVKNESINLVDIMPSILHLSNITPPEQTLGRSFWEGKETLLGEKKVLSSDVPPDYSYSELGRGARLKALITPEWKYIYDYKNKTEQLYDVTLDPIEQNNLADERREQCNRLNKKLSSWVSQSKKYPPGEKPIELSPREEEKLKNLGYID